MTVLKVRARIKIEGLIADEAGAVALDYGMIASILAVAVITGLSPVGNNLGSSFKAAADAILTAQAPTPQPAGAPPFKTLPPKAEKGG
jgi:pilus assembly protein Flp/PilA